MKKHLFTIIILVLGLSVNAQTLCLAPSSTSPFTVGANPTYVISADFNNDGKADLAVTNGNVSVLLGNGFGSFAPAVVVGTGSYLTSADFNADGNTDLAVSNGNVSILLGNGLGSFAPAVVVGTGYYLTSTDINADGNADLTAVNGNDLSVLLGNGVGGFASAVNFAVGTWPASITSADFNGDGNKDLATANSGSNDVSVLLGNGVGGFASAVNFAAGTGSLSITSADFNADGNVDLAVANRVTNNVSVLLGNGAGSFALATNFAVGTWPFSITNADFNADGNIDLAVANDGYTSGALTFVSVLLGNGVGSFAPATDFSVGTNPRALTSADFNADGKADLAVANYSSSNVSVLLNGLSVTANATATVVCTGASITLTGGGATNYTWNGGVSNGVAFIPPPGSTTYTVTGTDPNGCSATATKVITVNPLPTVTANTTATTACLGTSITLTGGGADTYVWTGGVTDGVGFNPPAGTTTYTVTGTNATTNCSNTATVTLTINSVNTSVSKNNNALTAIMPNATYQWLDCNNGLAPIPGETNQSYTPVTHGTYAVIVTKNNCSDTSACYISQNCMETTALEYLHGNDVKAAFLNGGDMFWDMNQAQYMVPYQTGQAPISTFFASALWLGGYDSGGNLMLAAQTYRGGGNDYWAGPLDPATGNIISNDCSDFDRIWQVKRWEIEDHLQDFDNDGIINNNVSLNILKWPGRGNPQFTTQMGFNLPNQDLAPFFDRNTNGIYEPMLGDYPVFEHGNANAISEDMLWYVFNDNGNIHTQADGQPLKVEVQATAYSFYVQNDSLLSRTIFVKNKIINRNNITIYNFKAGIWSDFDLGCANDDYIGTVPNLNTVYAYNQDNYDDSPCGFGGTGYGVNPPVQAITLLNQNMSSSMYYINSSSSPIGNPLAPLSYYRLLSGRWPNNTALTFGGNGYNPSSTNFTNFAFPDNPNIATGWSMYSQALSGLDTRIVASTSKDSLLPNEAFQMDIAYSYHRDNDSSCVQNVNRMYQQIPMIQQFYNNGHNVPLALRKVICSSDCVYPGDMNNNGIVSDFDLLNYGVTLGQNPTVAARPIPTDDWWPYDLPIPNTNGRIDANGDGTIDNSDWAINTDHWSKTHTAYTGMSEGFNTQGNDLFFKRYLNNSFLPQFNFKDTVDLNKNAAVFVHLGDTNQTLSNVYGLTFRIDYDKDVFDLLPSTNPFLNLTAGWIGGAFRQMNKSGRIHFVNVRTDGLNVSGGGYFGQLRFKVKPTAPITQQVMTTQFCFSDFQAIDSAGNNIPIGAQCITVYYRDPNFVLATNLVSQEKYNIRLAPNPTTGFSQLLLELPQYQSISIQLFDIMGREVQGIQQFELMQGEHQLPLDTQGLLDGIYFCRVQIGEVQETIKLVKLSK